MARVGTGRTKLDVLSQPRVGLKAEHDLLPRYAVVDLALFVVVFVVGLAFLLVDAKMDARKEEAADLGADGLAGTAEGRELWRRVLVVADDVRARPPMRRREGREEGRVPTEEVRVDVGRPKELEHERKRQTLLLPALSNDGGGGGGGPARRRPGRADRGGHRWTQSPRARTARAGLDAQGEPEPEPEGG